MTDINRYIVARWAYSVGSPIMSDAEYSILHRSVLTQHPTNPYCLRSWSSDPCPAELLRSIGREDLIQAVVLSDKTESIGSLNSIGEVYLQYGSMHTIHSVSYKLDGWNVQASYYDGLLINIQTRGRASDAMRVNSLSSLIPSSIPCEGSALVVMECLVPNGEFPWFKETFGVTSQRGAVSTALANPARSLAHIAVIAHGVRCKHVVTDKFALLQSWGFEVPMHADVSTYSSLMNQVQSYSDFKESYPYPTDGLVIEGEYTKALRVLAWEEPIYRSYVIGYEETYGPHSIAIQCNISPVQLSNSVQRRLPATNLSRVIGLDLQPGAPIAFRIASSAIADIDEESTRLLHKEWRNRWVEYRNLINLDARMKQMQEAEHI